MSVHVSSVSSFDFPSDKIIIADINSNFAVAKLLIYS